MPQGSVSEKMHLLFFELAPQWTQIFNISWIVIWNFSTNLSFQTEVKGHGGASQEFPRLSDVIFYCAMFFPGIVKLHTPVFLNEEINVRHQQEPGAPRPQDLLAHAQLSILSTQSVAAPFYSFNLHTDKLAFSKFLTGCLKWPSGTSAFFFFF